MIPTLGNRIRYTNKHEARSFLGHVGFYKRFIKDFSKISRPLCRLLEKDANFDFDESCRSTFEEIKSRLVIVPIMLMMNTHLSDNYSRI